MVQLSLSSPTGNQGVRFFPYTGYLGLTPVKVEGVVRTKLDSDNKPLPAKAITVSIRCFESRLGRVNSLKSSILVDYTQVLWSTPNGQEYADIGDLEFPFRISLPAKIGGFSTICFVEYRCIWRVEAVIHHIPITGVGVRQSRHFDLPFIRYDVPPHPPPLPPSFALNLTSQTNKPRAPLIRYSLNTPTSPIGPLDLVSIPLHLLPHDSAVVIRSASVIVERQIQLHEFSGQLSPPSTPISPSSSPSSPIPIPYSPTCASTSSSPASPVHSHSFQNSASSITVTPNHIPNTQTFSSGTLVTDLESRLPFVASPLTYPTSPLSSTLSSRMVSTSVAGAESSGPFTKDANGIWTKTLTLQWPPIKPHSRWAIGETIQSDLITVKFYARVKIVVSSPSGTESIDLMEQELLIVSTNEAERRLAVSKYDELSNSPTAVNSTRSKSKSPRRSRRDRDTSAVAHDTSPLLNGDEAPAVPKIRPEYTHKMSSTLTTLPTRVKSSSSRRPHTSAGPRDKPHTFDEATPYSRVDGEPDPAYRLQSRSAVNPRLDTVYAGGRSSIRPDATPSRNQTVPSALIDGLSVAVDHVQVRAWEDELVRIEKQSRLSSASMLGFSFSRRRAVGETR